MNGASLALAMAAIAVSACKDDPAQYSAAVLAIDSTHIVFELRGPSGTHVHDDRLSPGGTPIENGVSRWDYQWRWLREPLASPMCFEFTPRWPRKRTRRCIALPYSDAVMRRIPPAGQFAVLESSDAGSLLVAAPGARSLTVGGAPVTLDTFGVGRANVDLRARFFSTPRPSPADWSAITIPVTMDGASLDARLDINGTQWMLAALEQPAAPDATLDGVLIRSATGQLERRSGASTLPRLYVSETRNQTQIGSCYGRRKLAVQRSFVVRDLRTGQVTSERTFAPRGTGGCPREYIINLRDRAPYLYEPEESEVRRWLDTLGAR